LIAAVLLEASRAHSLWFVLSFFAPPILIVFFLGRVLANWAITSDAGLMPTLMFGLLAVLLNAYAVASQLAGSVALGELKAGLIGVRAHQPRRGDAPDGHIGRSSTWLGSHRARGPLGGLMDIPGSLLVSARRNES
jgi:hypothetical protein